MAEKKASKFKVKIPKLNPSKTYDFSFSLSGMISAVGGLVLALTFFFVMGILIGRGYRPEADMPKLAEMMPTKEHGQIITEEPQKPEVLKPEELDYAERLATPPKQVMNESEPATIKEELQKPVAKPQPKAEQEPAPKPAPRPATPETAQATPGEPVYDYVYQVASFRKEDMAKALSAKLYNAGLRTVIETGEAKGDTWHRVQVLHHGTAASTAGMKEILAANGIGKPLLRKKNEAIQ